MQLEQKKVIYPFVYLGFVLIGAFIVLTIDSYFFASSGDNLILNDKQFFGMMGNNASAITISLILTIVYSFFALKNKLYIPLLFVISGVLANITSRIYLGGAIDYIKLYSIPAFNIADVTIILGMFLSVYFFSRNSGTKSNKKRA